MLNYTEKTFEDWQKAKNYLAKFPHTWIFRGQAKDWDLRTSLERADFHNTINRREQAFIEEFKRGATNYLEPQQTPQTQAGWLSLMQHHGAPTRLLDFSFSPYVASYFAFEEDISEDSIIWAIESNYFRNESGKLFFENYPEIEEDNKILFEDLIPPLIEDNQLTCAFPFEPTRQNKRFKVQQGIFMCIGSTLDSFEESLSSFEKASLNIEKIILKNDLRGEALYDLNQMNITRESLFQNLDSFAKKLTIHFDTLFSYMVPMERAKTFRRNPNN